MSNYYTPHCLDCKTDMLEDGCNHGDAQLVTVIRNANTVTTLIEVGVQVSVGHEHIDGPWLREHKDHRIVVMSEYKDHCFEADGTRVVMRVLGAT